MDYNDFRKFTDTASYDGAFKCGELAMANNDLQGAIIDFSKALEFSPNSYDALHNKLLCLMKLNRYEAAIPISEKICSLENDFAPHFTTLGVCLAAINNVEKAEKAFAKSISLDSTEYWVYFHRGELRFRGKQFYSAFYDFTKCIEIDEQFTGAFDYRGRIRGILLDHIGAINDFQKILSVKPDDGMTIFNLAVTYININEVEKGESLLRKAETLGIHQATQILNQNR